MTVSELEKLGYKIVIFPAVGFMAATLAIEKALEDLKKTGTDWSARFRRQSFGGFLLDLEADWLDDEANACSTRGAARGSAPSTGTGRSSPATDSPTP